MITRWRRLTPLGLSVSDAAKALRVSRKTLSEILNGHARISPEMAIRLAIAFATTPESWLNQQTQYDIWKAGKKRKALSEILPRKGACPPKL